MEMKDAPPRVASRELLSGSASPPPWWRTFLFRVLTGRQLTVFMYLSSCMDGNDECRATTEEIRAFVGLNRATMIFEAIAALDRYGFIVRHRRVLSSSGGRRNLYLRPPAEYTVLKLLEQNVLDERLTVRHDEQGYSPEILRELDDALRALLGPDVERYFAAESSGERKAVLMRALRRTVQEKAPALAGV